MSLLLEGTRVSEENEGMRREKGRGCSSESRRERREER